MADYNIDSIFIDIKVKNTGLKTLKTATNNLHSVIDTINTKPIDINLSSSTLNTIKSLTKLVNQLFLIEKLTKKAFNVKVDSNLDKNDKKSNSKSSRHPTDIISTTVDTNGEKLKEFQRTYDRTNRTMIAQLTNAFGKVLKSKKVTYGDNLQVETIQENTKNLNDGITKTNFLLDENNEKWKKSSTSIKQTADGVLKIDESFDKTGKSISKTTTLTDDFGNVVKTSTEKIAKSKKIFEGFSSKIISLTAKMTILGYGISQISNLFKNLVNESNQYIENLNLFRVTFGNLADEAERFVDVYSKALGLDPSQVMRNLGFFNQIVTGFGVSTEEGYKMSKLLTQLAYDLSSFVNIDIQEAMFKFQSGIAGELEPLRRVGYALDEATLQQVAYNHGIEESIRTMTQAEKAYLRLIAMYEQSANVMGDLGATIQSPANALRILDQQLTLFKRSIGNAIVPIIMQFVPVIQGATKALTEFFNLISTKVFNYDIEGVRDNAITEYFDNVTDSAKQTENAIKGTLLSFDKFSVLGDKKKEQDDFKLPIPEYDALAGLVKSVDTTAESVYNWFKKIFLNEDATDFSDTLKVIIALLDTITTTVNVIWNVAIKPILPAITWLIGAIGSIANAIAKVLDWLGLLKYSLVTVLAIGFTAKVIKLTKTIMTTLNPAVLLFKKLLIAVSHPVKSLKTMWLALVAVFIKVKNSIASLVMSAILNFGMMSKSAKILSLSLSGVGLALGAIAFNALFDSLDAQSRRVASSISLVISALTAGTIAWLAYKGAMSMGVAIPIILTSIGIGISSIKGLISANTEIGKYATGGFTPETSGSLFMAGENGRPELMGTVNGKNAVANVNSIETAMERASYRGMVNAIYQSNQGSHDNKDIVLTIDGKELARTNIKNTANALSRNYKVELNPR